MKKVIYLLLVGIVLVSCDKKEKSVFEGSTTTTESEKPSTNLSVLVEADQAMQLSLYYLTSGNLEYNEQERVNANYSGNGIEKVNFELNTNEIPTKIMLDFNAENTTKGVRLRGLELKNENRTINLEDNDLAEFFKFSDNIKSKESGIYNFVATDNGKFNPYIQSTEFYSKRIELELKK